MLRMGKLRNAFLCGILVLITVLCSILIPQEYAQAQASASLTVVAPTGPVQPGEEFDVTIEIIVTGDETKAAQFAMDYNPSLVELLSINEGNYYSDHGNNMAILASEDWENGYTGVYAIIFLGTSDYPDGTGTLATLHMKANTGISGITDLTLRPSTEVDSYCRVSNPTPEFIEPLTLNSGQVVIGDVSMLMVSTGTVTAIADLSATLHGEILDLGDASSADVFFEWGTSIDYGNTAPDSPLTINTAPTSFTADLSGLFPGTTYHYRAVATDGTDTVYGNDRTFQTTTSNGDPPVVVTLRASDVAETKATLHGSLEDIGSVGSGTGVAVFFEWGPTDDYGYLTIEEFLTAPGTFSYSLTGLDLDTEYHFEARAIGYANAYGGDQVFRTRGGAGGSNVTLIGRLIPAICIIVSPDEIDYGDVTPLWCYASPVNLTNCGYVDITVSAEVAGGQLFTDGTFLGDEIPSDFSDTIPVNGDIDVSVQLCPPGDIPIGQYEGLLTFWATAASP